MNWLDIAILAITIPLAILGLWKGIIKAAFGLAGLIAGIVLAGRYYHPLAGSLSSSGAAWSNIAAYAIILIAIFVIASIAGWFVSHLVHTAMLGWVDRLIGFLLGAGIGCMLCAAIIAIASKYIPALEQSISQSVLAKFLLDQFPLLTALLPGEFDSIHSFF